LLAAKVSAVSGDINDMEESFPNQQKILITTILLIIKNTQKVGNWWIWRSWKLLLRRMGMETAGTGFSFGMFIGISALGCYFSSTSHKTNNNDGNNSIRQR
jgi:hypothetical protein